MFWGYHHLRKHSYQAQQYFSVLTPPLHWVFVWQQKKQNTTAPVGTFLHMFRKLTSEFARFCFEKFPGHFICLQKNLSSTSIQNIYTRVYHTCYRKIMNNTNVITYIMLLYIYIYIIYNICTHRSFNIKSSLLPR